MSCGIYTASISLASLASTRELLTREDTTLFSSMASPACFISPAASFTVPEIRGLQNNGDAVVYVDVIGGSVSVPRVTRAKP